jgi:hypothetical protein
MTEQVQLACTISSTNPTAAVGLEIWIDDTQIYNTEHVTEPINFVHDFEGPDGEHHVRFVMKNKTPEHTVVDDNGNITKDAVLSVANVAFDDIELGHVFVDRAVYHHNFNGSQDAIEDKFFGPMGCNGHVSLQFTTPIYLWLLENM